MSGQGPQNPKEDMVVRPLGFLLASWYPDCVLEKSVSCKHQETQTKKKKKSHQKPASSNQKSWKWTV